MTLPYRDNLVHLGMPPALVIELENQVAPITNSASGTSNTNITTVGAGTLTAAAIVGGLITRSGSTAAYTDTTDTAALIIAALPNAGVGQAWGLSIKNTVAFAETLAAGSGVTLAGQTIIPANSVGRFLITYTAAGAVTVRGIGFEAMAVPVIRKTTALSTVGAGTITAAGIAGGVTTRSGSQSNTAFTDTTDTATAIIAAQPNANIGMSWDYDYQNNTNGPATLTGGTGVTVSGITVVPKGCWVRYLVTYTAATTITMVGVEMGANATLPPSKYTKNTTSGATTAAAGDLTGAGYVSAEYSAVGAANLTTRTATEMFGDTPNAQAGLSYMLLITNTSGGTTTLVAGTGVTITGTATLATNTTRLFNVVFPTSTTATIQSVSIGTIA